MKMKLKKKQITHGRLGHYNDGAEDALGVVAAVVEDAEVVEALDERAGRLHERAAEEAALDRLVLMVHLTDVLRPPRLVPHEPHAILRIHVEYIRRGFVVHHRNFVILQ